MRLTMLCLSLLSLPLPLVAQERPVRPARPVAPLPPPAPLAPKWPPSLEWPLEYAVAPEFDGLRHLDFDSPWRHFEETWEDATNKAHTFSAWDVTPPMSAMVWDNPGVRGLSPRQGTREDSLFRAAREALNRGEYQRASDLFRSFEREFPASRSAPAALYWQAFALYRIGTQARLVEARSALQAVRERHAEAAADAEVASLLLRVQGALAARGDTEAAARLRAATANGIQCDKEEMAVRAEALNALAGSDATAARDVIERVLARRDECSVPLRRRAVYLLGRSTTDAEGMAPRLMGVIRTDPDRQVRTDALSILGRIPGATTLRFLSEMARSDEERRVRQAAISAIAGQEGEEAKALLQGLIEDARLEEALRASAINAYASSARSRFIVTVTRVGASGGVGVAPAVSRGGDKAEQEARGAWLRALHGRLTDRSLRHTTLQAIGRLGGETNTRWLLDLARNTSAEDTDRSTALSQIRSTELTAAQLGQLYDGITSRSMRRSVINLLGRRDEPGATDKLIEIARSGTDPETRRAAISALARKNDPRATQLLLELVEK